MEGLTEGRIVHFVLSNGTNRGEHRPAIVVRVWRVDGKPQENGLCQLQVFTDSSLAGGSNDNLPGVMWMTSVVYDAAGAEGTWHWIEKA